MPVQSSPDGSHYFNPERSCSMIVIPAVDIKEGRCVRLLQGREDSETVFSDDPSAMARKWEAEGAKRLHVVDLDGAFKKSPQNVDAIKRIVEQVTIPVQLGGGIRNMETIAKYLDLGVTWVIIGTEAIKNPGLVEEACAKFPGHIIVGIDARRGMIAIEGWVETTEKQAIEVAQSFQGKGVDAIVFTDRSDRSAGGLRVLANVAFRFRLNG